MVYIQIPSEYRYEVNELVKLFLPENTFTFAKDTTAVENGVVLCCRITCSKQVLKIHTVLFEDNQEMDRETMQLDATGTPRYNTIKMPIKIAIYRILSKYTDKKLPWGVLTGIRPGKIVQNLIHIGKSKKEIKDKLTGYYHLSEKKADLVMEVVENGCQYSADALGRASIYIGIPFCTSRCLYCSFPSVSTEKYGYLMEGYLNALKQEIIFAAEWIREKKKEIDTIYIGGGTPTALSKNMLEALLFELLPLLPVKKTMEYTIEAGRPDTINRDKLKLIKKAGATRISINPQTMQDKTLRLIGRGHSSYQVEKVFDEARTEGFDNINMDLIAGLPEETVNDFYNTMEKIRGMDPESVTVHTMALKRASRLREENTQFFGTEDDMVSKMVEMAAVSLREEGYRPYYLYRQKNILANLENVGYSKPGFEGIYNMLIMEERQTILAIGAGAVSKMVAPGKRMERIFNVKNVEQYIKRIEEMIDRKRKIF